VTVTEMRARIERINLVSTALTRESRSLVLAIEEAEGRPGSSEARFARALLAGDQKGMQDAIEQGEREREEQRVAAEAEAASLMAEHKGGA
jgi:hypothetical protein